MLVPDTLKDVRFADNPMVVGEPHIRFYAGVPVKDVHGNRLGVFCIKDRVPRTLSPEDQKLLKDLASWASLEIQIIQLQAILLKNDAFQRVVGRELEESRNLNKLVVGREIEMVKLKERVADLEKRLAEAKS